MDTHLSTSQTDRLVTERMDGHRHQSNAHLFTRGKQHVHFTSRWSIVDLIGQVDQQVGVVAHSANHDDDLIAALLSTNCLTSCRQNLLWIRDARTTKLLYYQCHNRYFFLANTSLVLRQPRKLRFALRPCQNLFRLSLPIALDELLDHLPAICELHRRTSCSHFVVAVAKSAQSCSTDGQRNHAMAMLFGCARRGMIG